MWGRFGGLWGARLLRFKICRCGGLVIGSIHCALGGRRGSEVCMAGLGLSGKWCPHRRKRRKQLEEEEPKRGRSSRPASALSWGGGVSPVNRERGDLEGESHLLRLISV